MAGRDRAASRAPRVLAGVGVVALIVVVAVLSVWALQHGRAGSGVVPRSAPPAPSVAPSTASPPASPLVSPPAPAPTAPGAAERFLAAGAAVWWRATAGACDGVAPVVERSTDAGATWSVVTPSYRGVAQVRALEAFSPEYAQMVVDAAECEIGLWRTFTDGRFWEPYPEVFEAASYVPAEGGTVVVGGEPVAAPCAEPWGLRVAGESAALVCEGSAFGWDGEAWMPLAEGAVAVAVSDVEVWVAHPAEACDGFGVTRFGDDAVSAGCLAGATAPLALAVDADGGVHAWSGDIIVPAP